jgi:hypothetical protein
MCQRCNYAGLLDSVGLDPTPGRVRVLEVVGNNSAPVSAQDIFATVSRSANINRVTVYRILDVLVEKGLVERLSGGRRSLVYGPPRASAFPLPQLRRPPVHAAGQPQGRSAGHPAFLCRRDPGRGGPCGRHLHELLEKELKEGPKGAGHSGLSN